MTVGANSLILAGSLANTVGTINPFRYRGYYYDTETGLYYLQSRYYDANTGRFLNADGQVNDGLAGINIFSYCGNNPVNMVDSDGHFAWALPFIAAFSNPITAIIAVVAIVAVIVITYVAVSHAVHDYNVSHIKYSSEVHSNFANNKSKGKSVTHPTSNSKNNFSKSKNSNSKSKQHNLEKSPSSPKIKIPYPGNNPTVKPSTDYEWRGKGTPSSGKGSWFNPKTKISLHHDLSHPEPIGPHWDVGSPDGNYRLFPDGRVEFK